MTGTQLVNVWFARSERAVLPAAWDSPLVGFSGSVPGECVAGEYDCDPDPVRLFPPPERMWLRRPPFAVVADFDGGDGAVRVVVPEVQINVGERGYAVRWMLSPQAMGAAQVRHGKAGAGDG